MEVVQKEIVLISYPFTDLKTEKVRPALVISNNNFNRKSSDFVAIPITSAMTGNIHAIPLANADLESGKLIKESMVRADKLFSVEQKLVVAKIGKLKENSFRKIILEVKKIIE